MTKRSNAWQFFGIRHYIDNFVARKWTRADVDAAEAFYKTHNAGFTPYPFPRELFFKFIKENDGHFPVIIEALPEVTPSTIPSEHAVVCCQEMQIVMIFLYEQGTVAYTHTPCFIITAEDEYSRLCTYLETLLTMVRCLHVHRDKHGAGNSPCHMPVEHHASFLFLSRYARDS
jgi:hypothetical protein